MKYKIEFFFGVGEDKSGNPITIARKLDALVKIKNEAMQLFGGYTLLKTEGGWKNDAGRLVEEPGYVLVILQDVLQEFRRQELAAIIKEALNQNSVAVATTAIDYEFL